MVLQHVRFLGLVRCGAQANWTCFEIENLGVWVCRGAALPCPALPCPALPYPALPCPTLPCPALPCPAQPCPALPCPALPCPAPTHPEWTTHHCILVEHLSVLDQTHPSRSYPPNPILPQPCPASPHPSHPALLWPTMPTRPCPVPPHLCHDTPTCVVYSVNFCHVLEIFVYNHIILYPSRTFYNIHASTNLNI